MTTLERELARVNWDDVPSISGPTFGRSRRSVADRVPSSLRLLASATSPDDAWRAYDELDNYIVIQGTRFDSAALTILPLLLIACTGAPDGRRTALDLLVILTNDEGDPTLIDRDSVFRECVRRAREGIALAYALLDSDDTYTRLHALELLDNIDEDRARLLWHAQRLADADPEEKVRERASWIVQDA